MVLLEVVIVVEEKKNGVVISASSISFNLSAHSDIISSRLCQWEIMLGIFLREGMLAYYAIEYLVLVDTGSCQQRSLCLYGPRSATSQK